MHTEIKIKKTNTHFLITAFAQYGETLRPVYTLTRQIDERDWYCSLASCPSGTLDEHQAILSISLHCHQLVKQYGKNIEQHAPATAYLPLN